MKFMTLILTLLAASQSFGVTSKIDCSIEYGSQRQASKFTDSFIIEANSSKNLAFGTLTLTIGVGERISPAGEKLPNVVQVSIWSPKFADYVARATTIVPGYPAQTSFYDREYLESLMISCQESSSSPTL
jgi:hypothetical protein